MTPAIIYDPVKHWYTLASTGRSLPSVTRILRASGIGVPSKDIPPFVLERARRRGNAVHSICESIDAGQEIDVAMFGHDDAFRIYAESYQQAVMRMAIEVIAVEQAVCHPLELYAGRYDLQAWIQRTDRAIIDRKATFAMNHEATMAQTFAYADAHNAANPSEPVTKLFGLHLTKSGPKPREYDMAEAGAIWREALAKYRAIKEGEPVQEQRAIEIVSEEPTPEFPDEITLWVAPPGELPQGAGLDQATGSAIVPIDVTVREEVSGLMKAALALAVTDTGSAQEAVDFSAECARRQDRIKKHFYNAETGMCHLTHVAWKAAVKQCNDLMAQYGEPEAIVRQRLTEYGAVIERQRKEAIAIAAAESQRLAEAEKQKRIAEAKAKGDTERAARVEAAPAPAVVVSVVAPPPVEVKGATFTETHVAECYDLAAVVKAVADGIAPLTLLQLDKKAADALAKAFGEKLAIPGLRAVAKSGLRVRK